MQEQAKVSKVRKAFIAMREKQKGLTTVEYAIAGSLVALAVVVAFSDLGEAVGNAINTMTGVINNGAP